MRHRVGKSQMNRDKDHRKALLMNLSRSLILAGSITTTLEKAKYVKPFVERLVTRAKRGNTPHNISLVSAKLRATDAVQKLFRDVAPKYTTVNGGYTRIVKKGYRVGDKASVATISWVEPAKKVSKSSKKEVKEHND